jgi:hypothetical protein
MADQPSTPQPKAAETAAPQATAKPAAEPVKMVMADPKATAQPRPVINTRGGDSGQSRSAGKE